MKVKETKGEQRQTRRGEKGKEIRGVDEKRRGDINEGGKGWKRDGEEEEEGVERKVRKKEDKNEGRRGRRKRERD